MSATRSSLHARLAAAIVAAMTAEALAFDTWPAVAVAAVLSLLDGVLRPSPFRVVARLLSSQQYPLRPDGPARRGALVRAGGLAVAATLLAVGLGVAGVIVAALVAADAAADALVGRCLSCAARLGARPSPTDALALEGRGPWLVGVSAKDCVLCERVVDVLVEKATGPVERRTLEDCPGAGEILRVVPAVVVVSSGGAMVDRLDAPRHPDQIEQFLSRRSASAEAADT